LSTVVSLHEHHHMREHCSRRYGLRRPGPPQK